MGIISLIEDLIDNAANMAFYPIPFGGDKLEILNKQWSYGCRNKQETDWVELDLNPPSIFKAKYEGI